MVGDPLSAGSTPAPHPRNGASSSLPCGVKLLTNGRCSHFSGKEPLASQLPKAHCPASTRQRKLHLGWLFTSLGGASSTSWSQPFSQVPHPREEAQQLRDLMQGQLFSGLSCSELRAWEWRLSGVSALQPSTGLKDCTFLAPLPAAFTKGNPSPRGPIVCYQPYLSHGGGWLDLPFPPRAAETSLLSSPQCHSLAPPSRQSSG